MLMNVNEKTIVTTCTTPDEDTCVKTMGLNC